MKNVEKVSELCVIEIYSEFCQIVSHSEGTKQTTH